MTDLWSWQRFEATVSDLIEREMNHQIESDDEWHVIAKEIVLSIRRDSWDAKDVPEEFWHYMGDFDIRMRNSEYAKSQIERLTSAMADVARNRNRSA